MKRKPLFSLTKHDFHWDYFRCPGKGGQHVNKTSSGVRCTHKASGAVGQACDHREQPRNKKLAFERMTSTPAFKKWVEMEISRKTGQLDRIEREVERGLKKIRVEVKDEKGRWVEVARDETLSNEESL